MWKWTPVVDTQKRPRQTSRSPAGSLGAFSDRCFAFEPRLLLGCFFDRLFAVGVLKLPAADLLTTSHVLLLDDDGAAVFGVQWNAAHRLLIFCFLGGSVVGRFFGAHGRAPTRIMLSSTDPIILGPAASGREEL